MKISQTYLFQLEARLVFRQRWLLALLLILAALLALVAVDGLRVLHLQAQTLSRVRALEDRTLSEGAAQAARLDAKLESPAPFRDPRDPATFARLLLQTPILKLPPPAAILDASQANLLPSYFQLNIGPANKVVTAYEYDNPQGFVLGRLDFSFVLVYLLPLFFILAAHSIRTGEIQAGIAPLLRVSSDAPFAVYTRRLLTACVPFLLLFVAGELISVSAAAAILHAGITESLKAALGAFSIAILYAAVWAGILLLIIRHSRSPAAALVKLLTSWIVLVLLVPALATVVAARLYPATPRATVVDEIRRVNDDIARQTPQLTKEFALAHPGSHQLQGPIPVPAGAVALITNQAADRALAPRERSMEQTTRSQLRVLRLFAVLSPALATQTEMDRLSGFDLTRHAAFLRQTEQAITELREYFGPILVASGPGDPPSYAKLTAYPRFRSVATPLTAWFDLWDAFCFLLAAGICASLLASRRERLSL